MKVIQKKDYEEISRTAAERILAMVQEKPSCVLGLATGSTPIRTYEFLAMACQQRRITFEKTCSINLDEYVGLGEADPQSYRFFMETHLFRHIDIKRENTHLPDGLAADLEAECRRYDALYAQLGGVDLQLLGIGQNGHIGFNEPGAVLDANTHVALLSENTRAANSRNFSSLSEVPHRAITLGMGGILKARHILLLASGEQKKEAVQKALYGKVDPAVPASFLQLHPDVTVLCDFALT